MIYKTTLTNYLFAAIGQRLKFFTKFLIVLLLLVNAACLFDDPEALKAARKRVSFQEVATYGHRTMLERNKQRGVRRHKVILIQEKVEQEKLIDLAHKLHRAYTNTTFDFFDDAARLQEYVSWDKQNNDWNDTGLYGTIPYNMEEYVRTHRIARITLAKDRDQYYKWILIDPENGRIVPL